MTLPSLPQKRLSPLYQVTPDLNPDATIAKQGVLGVVGEKVGRAAAGLVGLSSDVHQGARTLTSGAMEGTGKLLFGMGNKPAFGMEDGPAAPNAVTPVATATTATQPNLGITDTGQLPTLPAMQAKQPTTAMPVMGTLPSLPSATQPATGTPTSVDGVSRYTKADGTPVFSNTPQTTQSIEKPKPILGGGTTPQQRYATQQQELQQPEQPAQATSLPAFRPNTIQGNPLVQQAMDRAATLNSKDMTVGENRINAKYANALLSEILPSDTANQGLQQRANEQGQEAAQYGQTLAETKAARGQEAWKALLNNNMTTQEAQSKAGYYASEAALNNEKVRQGQLPAKPEPEKWSNTQDANGNPVQVNNQGIMRLLRLDDKSQAIETQKKYEADVQKITDSFPDEGQDVQRQKAYEELRKAYGL